MDSLILLSLLPCHLMQYFGYHLHAGPMESLKSRARLAAVRDGFQWLDTEKYGISITPYFFGASGRVYPITIEQLHAKSADDLEFDLSQEAEDPGYSLDVRAVPPPLRCKPPVLHLPLTMRLQAGRLSSGIKLKRSSRAVGISRLCMSENCCGLPPRRL